ncbi:MAG: hypothetical protein HONBIEJF_01813 [Fimbriimonadaceae bacterium]|nr:hypothetical protein [Fimbriimonadaceae bacterium]
MQIENSQCTLAQAQIGRYVAGETLPEDVLTSLEAHLEECTNCRALVREQRAALEIRANEPAPQPIDPPNLTDSFPEPETDIANPAPVAEVALEPTAEPVKSQPATKLRLPAFRDALHGARTGKRKLGHPLVWSGALAIVLIAMSYVARNPSLIFGKKASEIRKESQATVAKASDEDEGGKAESSKEGKGENPSESTKVSASDQDQPGPKPHSETDEGHASAQNSAVESTKDADEPAKTKSASPERIPIVKKTSPPTVRRSIRRQAPARPRQDTGTIRIYDSAGKPIDP